MPWPREAGGGRGTEASPYLIALLVLVAMYGTVSLWRRAHRPSYVVAYTTCPLRGPARVVIDPARLPAPDYAAAVRAHENVHAAQCARLGPLRYWLTNLRPSGKLALEAPGYCAYARARLLVDPDTEYANDRLHEDLITTMSDVDSADVKAALMAACPEIASKPRRTRSPARH